MRIINENDTLRYDNENECDGETESYATNNSKIRLIRDKKFTIMKKETARWAIQILLSILSAIATALGATSCMRVH